MRKRILCILLAALIVLSLIPAFALPSQAASNMKTGEVCIEMLKEMEGFLKYPVWDHNHYSVGYGSTCEKDDYPDGITEEEADALMRQFLSTMEEELNKFANRNGILFSQNQFDALMLFTYNCGTGWLYGNGDFRQAVLDNTSGNDFIFYMTQWSTASSQLHLGLVNRRLIEADMYLNGNYNNTRPSSYTYVIYDNNGGDGSARVQGYDCNLTAFVKATPTLEDHKFLGWYSAAEGGSWITELSSQNAEQKLYAHWQSADATVQNPAPASYELSSDLLASLQFYDAPNGTVAGTLNEYAMAVIQGEYVDDNGVKWGKLPNDCWVNLGDPRIGTGDETQVAISVKVNVTGDYVNVRTGPGTQYKVLASVVRGDQIVITEIADVDGVLWGKFRAGWVCLQYTDYSGGLTPGQPGENESGGNSDSDTVIAVGIVTSNGLNIRATAGAHGYLMGAYKQGDRVEILQKTYVGGTPWGRTDRGWICLTYVKLEEAAQPPETTEPETTVPETTVPETTVPETTEPDSGKDETDSTVVRGIPATVISKTMLNIRSGAGTNFSLAGSYSPGEKISILEQKTVGGVIWGRTDKGWVSMQYVKLDDAWTNESGVYGLVISASGLNIRSGPGVANPPVGNYTSGQRIVILEQKTVSGVAWGRTDKGWVCMTHVRLEQSVPGGAEPTVPETTVPETTTPEPTVPEVTEPENPETENKPAALTGTVTASGLNVRATAGINGAIVGGYRKGDKITILEQTVVNGTAWGRTEKGWVSLAYVKLDEIPITPDAPRTGIITASSLCIRKGPGTGNALVGTYARGTKVTIVESVKIGATTWGRTDKGWICMDYVK